MTMRNIKLADELITKTFGVNGIDVRLLKFQIDKTKLLFVIEQGSITAQFDLRESKIIHKIDGDKVPFEIQNALYEKAQHIRNELFNDPEEDDDQLTMDDLDDDVIDAEYEVMEDEEQLQLGDDLQVESTDDIVEDMSDSSVDIDDEDESDEDTN